MATSTPRKKKNPLAGANNRKTTGKAPRDFIFKDILLKAQNAGYTNYKRKESVEWFKSKVRGSTKLLLIHQTEVISEGARAKRNQTAVVPGRMYFWMYDPKHKDTLPFYDSFPLGFIVDFAKDGFTGLNFHYAPLPYRAALLSGLYRIAGATHLTPKTKIKVSYNMLKAASKMQAFKPCFKRYLYGHVRSQFVEVQPIEWPAAIWLPIAVWNKKSERAVHMWSKRQIEGR